MNAVVGENCHLQVFPILFSLQLFFLKHFGKGLEGYHSSDLYNFAIY